MVKERLLQIIKQHQTPQTQMYAPMLMMILSSMNEDQVVAMITDIRRLLEEVMQEPETCRGAEAC